MKKVTIKHIPVTKPLYASIVGEWAIIHRCKMCGSFSSNRIAADDNPIKLMSIAMKPISMPPFPIEKIVEMTKMMGGEGCLK